MSCDWNRTEPVANCDLCKGGVFGDELVHFIDGYIICAECFDDFAVDYFESNMILGNELKENFHDSDRASY